LHLQVKAPLKITIDPKFIRSIQRTYDRERIRQASGKSSTSFVRNSFDWSEDSILEKEEEFFKVIRSKKTTPVTKVSSHTKCPYKVHFDYPEVFLLSQDYKLGLDPKELLMQSIEPP